MYIIIRPFYVGYISLYGFLSSIYFNLLNFRFYLNYPKLLLIDIQLYVRYFFRNHSASQVRCDTSRNEELTYGESTFFLLHKALKHVENLGNMATFYDLGCGKGRLVLFMSLFTRLKSVGIDLLPEFISIAKQVSSLNHLNTEFLLEDFLESDLSKANLIYVTWTCFVDSTRQQLTSNFEQLPNLHYIFSVSYPVESDKFKCIAKIKGHFSWGKGHLYINKKVA